MYESASYIYCIVHKYKSKHNTYVYESIHLYIHAPFIYTERRRCLVRTTFAIVLVSVLLTHSLSLSRSRTFNLSCSDIDVQHCELSKRKREKKNIIFLCSCSVVSLSLAHLPQYSLNQTNIHHNSRTGCPAQYVCRMCLYIHILYV